MGTLISKRTDDALGVSFVVVVGIFAVTLADSLLGLSLTRFGIVPRTLSGLWGILWSPLLHANLPHVAANALPLFVLLTLLLSHKQYHPERTLGLIWVASGLGTWAIGRGNAVHVGASSIIFGLAAFLIAAGCILRSWRSAGVAVLVTVAFGGIFYGVIPQAGRISWEGHLCGAFAGIWTATSTLKRR